MRCHGTLANRMPVDATLVCNVLSTLAHSAGSAWLLPAVARPAAAEAARPSVAAGAEVGRPPSPLAAEPPSAAEAVQVR